MIARVCSCCGSGSRVGLRASSDNLFSLLGVVVGASGDVGSSSKLMERAIASGLRKGRSGSEGTLNSSWMLMLIGAPSTDVGRPSLAMFFGATGVL